MIKVHISPEAARDLEETRRYIAVELKNPAAAKRTVRAVIHDLHTLEHFPEAGPSIASRTGYETDLRFFVCGSRLALYKIENGAVYVARVLDPRQDYLRVLFGDDFWEHTEN